MRADPTLPQDVPSELLEPEDGTAPAVPAGGPGGGAAPGVPAGGPVRGGLGGLVLPAESPCAYAIDPPAPASTSAASNAPTQRRREPDMLTFPHCAVTGGKKSYALAALGHEGTRCQAQWEFSPRQQFSAPLRHMRVEVFSISPGVLAPWHR